MKMKFRNRKGFMSIGRGALQLYVTVEKDFFNEYFVSPRNSFWRHTPIEPHFLFSTYLRDKHRKAIGHSVSKYLATKINNRKYIPAIGEQ